MRPQLGSEMVAGWAVVQTKPQAERSIAAKLVKEGFPAVFPRLHVAPYQSVTPLFPGYCFCYLDLDEIWQPICRWPGVTRILGGELPQFVDRKWFERFTNSLDTNDILHLGSYNDLREHLPGDMVRVMDGMFKGQRCECLWSSMVDVVISVMIFGRATEMRVTASSVKNLEKRKLVIPY